MVDWDRVEELRSKGWDWDRIAKDPKVGFHPEASVREPGRALRGLYHRQRSRERRQEAPAPKTKKETEARERRWTLTRVGYLLLPIFAVWFALAYVAPSPVGLIVPAIPYLALGTAVAAFLLVFGLWRSSGPRWSKALRTTLVTGIVLGLVVSGVIALGGVLLFGCPYLPPASSATGQPAGWTSVNVRAWQDGGRPVVYFYGATWCPYCSASSWAIWKALTEFGTVTGNYTSYSFGPPEGIQYIPEMVLAYAQLASTTIAWQVSEYVAGSDGIFPGTSNCYQQAYVTAYSGSSIPFVVVNGQYVHGGTSLIQPTNLQTWADGANGGAAAVEHAVLTEDSSAGSPWLQVQTQAWWLMAFMAKSTGLPVSQLASQYHWSSTTESQVNLDLQGIS